MASYQYERLAGQDNDFLLWESTNLPMHVAGAQIFEAGPLCNEHGGIEFDEIKRLTESILHSIPRYRQKLAWIPGENHAVWVDDEHFNLDYHFRHTSLPRPGTDEQLKLLIARLMEQPLDRSRPLWETWVIEGLAGNRFATVNKVHHCMIDGASGVELSQLLLSRTSERVIREAPQFIPRPSPRPRELRADQRWKRLAAPLETARRIVNFARDCEDPGGEVRRHVQAFAKLAEMKTSPASSTPINGAIGPHRIVEWASMSLADVKAVRRALDCTVNDVVLTIVTGAVRRLMQRRQVDPRKLEFRISAPVNVRSDRERGEMGNRVSSWLVRLPVGREDPLTQLREIHASTKQLKESDQASAVKLATEALGWLPFSIQGLSVGTMNSIVTNVPGPPFPLYLLGAEAEQMIPFGPLMENVGLVVGVLSYNGRLLWGFNADYDRLPDLTDFRIAIENAFERLADAAGVQLGAVPELAPIASEAESVPVRDRQSGPARLRGLPD
jgi:diacylglycerol O-acyltransferase